jgi:hypothetical protein
MAGKINSYADFQTTMDTACKQVGAEPDFAPHGRWWTTMTYEKFMSDGDVLGERIVAPGDPDNSRLIQALEGRPPFGDGGKFSRMPPGKPFEQATIDEIRDWIARNCPNGKPYGA